MGRTFPTDREEKRQVLLEAVERVRDTLLAGADEAEANATLPPATVQALDDAGLLALKLPAVLGGAEADLITQLEVLEAVGIPATFDICQGIVGPGGRIANIGVHGKSVELHLERLWSHNITLTTRLVDTVTTPMILKMALIGRLQPLKLVTHRFQLSEAMKAYDTFSNAGRERALKVVLKND